MILIVGGTAQGKLNYALSTYRKTLDDVADNAADAHHKAIFNHFHLYVRNRLAQGSTDLAAELEALLTANPDIIILCDEIGCGVVPIDRFERTYRETTGRLCCMLAARAERVERVFCGIATTIKG